MSTSFARLRTLAGSILAVILAVAAFVPLAPNTVERSETLTPISAEALGHATHEFRPIESLEVGQRVLTGFASDQDRTTAVDATTWKKLTLTATYHWNDGTPDTFYVTTLQSPEWMREHAAAIGAQVPMPLDVQEMGCPDGLLAEVESIEPCPAIQDSPGRVILTTVRHLNSACRTLSVRARDGTSEEIHTTDYHPFWSETKQGWVKAYTLSIGDQLQGLHGVPLTLVGSQSIPGIHTVYNMTVETEHVYRVGNAGCKVHNNNCAAEGELYDVGLAKDLRKNAPKYTQVNHTPQTREAELLVNGHSPVNKVGQEPAIRLTTEEHTAISAAQRARGTTASARDLLAQEIRDLRSLTNAPNAKLQDLIRLNKEMHYHDYIPLHRMDTP